MGVIVWLEAFVFLLIALIVMDKRFSVPFSERVAVSLVIGALFGLSLFFFFQTRKSHKKFDDGKHLSATDTSTSCAC